MTAAPQTNRSVPGGHGDELVRGRSTLQEIELDTGVPAAYLIEHLGLPPDVRRATGIGKLGKQYNFDIDDVRGIVRDHAAREH